MEAITSGKNKGETKLEAIKPGYYYAKKNYCLFALTHSVQGGVVVGLIFFQTFITLLHSFQIEAFTLLAQSSFTPLSKKQNPNILLTTEKKNPQIVKNAKKKKKKKR